MHVSSGQSPADMRLTCDGYAGWAAEGVSTEVDADGKELTCTHELRILIKFAFHILDRSSAM